jgi:hypothetical protein
MTAVAWRPTDNATSAAPVLRLDVAPTLGAAIVALLIAKDRQHAGQSVVVAGHPLLASPLAEFGAGIVAPGAWAPATDILAIDASDRAPLPACVADRAAAMRLLHMPLPERRIRFRDATPVGPQPIALLDAATLPVSWHAPIAERLANAGYVVQHAPNPGPTVSLDAPDAVDAVLRAVADAAVVVAGAGDVVMAAAATSSARILAYAGGFAPAFLSLANAKLVHIADVVDVERVLDVTEGMGGALMGASAYVSQGFVFRQAGALYRVVPRARQLPEPTAVLTVARELAAMGAMPHIADAPAVDRLTDAATVRVHQVPFVTHPDTWSTLQVCDAVVHLLHLTLTLGDRAEPWHLHDPHADNVTFDGSRPVYLDLGSLRPGRPTRDTWHHLLMTVLVVEAKHAMLANQLRQLLERCVATSDWDAQRRALLDAMQRLSGLTPVHAEHEHWSAYAADLPSSLAEFDAHARSNRKTSVVLDTLRRIQPATLTDFGANTGFFARMAAMLGSTVLATDNVEDVVDRGYRHARAERMPITFALVDLLAPPQAPGISGRLGALTDRWRADFVLGAAVTHHLAKAGMTFPAMAELFASATHDHLLVEFIPRTDRYVKTWGMPAWYTLDDFTQAFSAHFELEAPVASDPEPRVWLYGRKRSQPVSVFSSPRRAHS